MLSKAGLLLALCGCALAQAAIFPPSWEFGLHVEHVGERSVVVVGSWTVDGVQGWSWGLCHNPLTLSVTPCTGEGQPSAPCDRDMCPSIECPEDLLTCRGGEPPSYHAVKILPEGVIQGVLVDFATQKYLPPRSRFEMLKITYQCHGNGSQLRFCETLSDPVIPVAFSVESHGFAPARQVGTILMCNQHFKRGDVNGDGRADVADSIILVKYFSGENLPLPCQDAADIDDDGKLSVLDAIFLVNHVFSPGGFLPHPWFVCGGDPTRDTLTCEHNDGCSGSGDPPPRNEQIPVGSALMGSGF